MTDAPLMAALAGDPEIGPLFSDAAELAALLKVEAALARAAGDAGLASPEAAERVAAHCEGFHPDHGRLADGLVRDGVVVPQLVKELRAGVAEADRGALHPGATSQDIVDTGLVLRLREAAAILDRRLERLIGALDALAKRDGAVALVAHTRMQQALPFTAADKIASWRAPLARHRARLAEIGNRLFVVQFGGPVGTRHGLDGRGDSLAAALARRLRIGDAPQWHSGRDGLAEFGGWLALVAGALGKIGQDAALLAQSEVGEIRIAGGGGSSSMPHKANPVPAEVLVALARWVAGLQGSLLQALIHENERSGAAWTLEWLALPQMVTATGAATGHAERLLAAMSFVER